MSARDTILLALTRYYQGNRDPRGTAVQVIDGYDSARRAELLSQRTDTRERMLDDARAAGRAEALAEGGLLPKADVVAWLVKKAREDTPVWQLASKVDRGAIRPDNLRMLPADFFEPEHVYQWHDVWTFRCVAVDVHPETGARTAVGWWRTGVGPWQVHEYTDVHWSVHWKDVTDEVAL